MISILKSGMPTLTWAGRPETFVEEFIYRGVLWEMLSLGNLGVIYIVFIQALIFGLIHFTGSVPNGIWGVLLASIYGLLLGALRYQSKGLLVPMITHFFADAVIFFVLTMI